MLCCGNSKQQTLQKEAQMAKLKNATRFTTNDINELRKRFYRMSHGNQYLNKAQFRENMGLLGLDTVYFLSDRIFSILDNNQDEKIKFEEFVFYFDKITNGDQMEKAEISYKLIDQDRLGYFNLQDFQTTMHGLIQSWVIMTGQAMQTEMQVRLDQRIKDIFNQMDLDKDQRVTLIEYQDAVIKDPTLLEIFDFLKKGLSTSIQEAQFQREQMIIEEFSSIQLHVTSLYDFMLGTTKEQVISPVQIPQRMTIKNRSSMQQYLAQTSNRKLPPIQKGLSQLQCGVPYLLGDDDEVNQRSSWIPMQQSHTMKHQQSMLFQQKVQMYSDQEDGVVIKRLKSEYTLEDMKMYNPNTSPQKQSSPLSHRPEPEGIEIGEIQLRLRNKKQLSNRIASNDGVQVPEKEFNKDDEGAIAQRTISQAMTNNSQQYNTMNFQMQNVEKANFEREIDDQIAKYTNEELREKYKEVLMRLKDTKETMNTAIDKLRINQMDKEKDYLAEQEKKRQLIILKIRTAANVHKSSVKQSKKKDKDSKRGSQKSLSVHFGHENWNLVQNMMIGIQMAVKSVNAAEDLIVNPRDFQLKYYFELLPRRTGSDKETIKICKFFDYAPQVFNSIRRFYGIDNDDYLASIGPETLLQSLLKGDLSTLQELTSTGKSGSFFYYSADGRFTLKTISRDEFHFLKTIIKPYYEHLKKYNQTLIIKFFGMHKMLIKQMQSKADCKMYFIIMSNVFHTQYEIHQRYDLKGSLYKRSTPEYSDWSVARKDLDFIKAGIKLHVDANKRKEIINQLNRDCLFFAENNIIDYSLLVGIHNIKRDQLEKSEVSILSEEFDDYYIPDDLSVMKSIDDSQLYYFGIIDILTNFNAKKKLEYITKRVAYGPTISAVPPQDYAERFSSFMDKIFDDNKTKDPSKSPKP